MAEHPCFLQLQTTISTEVVFIDDLVIDKHAALGACHRDFHARAIKDAAAAIYLSPDSIWSNGAIATLDRLHRENKDIVFALGLRLIKEEVESLARAMVSEDGTVLDISNRELARLSMAHLHQITYDHFFEGRSGGLMPQGLIWPVGDKALLTHSFHLHPLLLQADHDTTFTGTIDFDLIQSASENPERIHVIRDSDELLVMELSPREMSYGAPLPKGSTFRVAQWSLQSTATTPMHWALFRHPIRLHSGTTSPNEWQSVESRATRIMRRIALWSLIPAIFAFPWQRLLSSQHNDNARSHPAQSISQPLPKAQEIWHTAFDRPAPQFVQKWVPKMAGWANTLLDQVGDSELYRFSTLAQILPGRSWASRIAVLLTAGLSVILNLRYIIVGTWPFATPAHFDWLRQRHLRDCVISVAQGRTLWLTPSPSIEMEGRADRLLQFVLDRHLSCRSMSPEQFHRQVTAQERFDTIIVDRRLVDDEGATLRQIRGFLNDTGRVFVAVEVLRRWGEPDLTMPHATGWHSAERLVIGSDADRRTTIPLVRKVMDIDRSLAWMAYGTLPRVMFLFFVAIVLAPVVNIVGLVRGCFSARRDKDLGFGYFQRLIPPAS